jgi:hypothetical protein
MMPVVRWCNLSVLGRAVFFYVSRRLNVAGKLQGVVVMMVVIVVMLIVRVSDQVQFWTTY